MMCMTTTTVFKCRSNTGSGSHPEARLSLLQSIFLLSLSLPPCHVPILSLCHVAGHVGNITGEILSTINSPSPYWLTLQHSSSLAGHSPSALADRRGCGLRWH